MYNSPLGYETLMRIYGENNDRETKVTKFLLLYRNSNSCHHVTEPGDRTENVTSKEFSFLRNKFHCPQALLK